MQFLDISMQGADRALYVLGRHFPAAFGEYGALQGRGHVLVSEPLPFEDDGEVGGDIELDAAARDVAVEAKGAVFGFGEVHRVASLVFSCTPGTALRARGTSPGHPRDRGRGRRRRFFHPTGR